MQRKVIFLVTTDWYFLSHRLRLALALKEAGYEVIVITGVGERSAEIAQHFTHEQIDFNRSSVNPIKEFPTLLKIISLYKKHRPDIVHHIALKPAVYGSLAAKSARVPRVINTIAGLGFSFVRRNFKTRALRRFMWLCFRLGYQAGCTLTIFQNEDDRKMFVRRKYVPGTEALLIRGSGVDIDKFQPHAAPSGTPVVLLPARMLWPKGVGVFVDAIHILNKRGVDAKYQLAGPFDPENRSAVPEQQLRSWHQDGLLEWLGNQSNMNECFAKASVVTLPSFYREGIPLVLLEAAAAGKPIVTTDTPGCREAVQDGHNGILVPAYDENALADAIEALLRDEPLRARMGQNSRKLAEDAFSLRQVNSAYLDAYDQLFLQESP